jgi:hypothetical protein
MTTAPVVAEQPVPKTEAEIRAEYESLFEVWKAKELANLTEKQQITIKEEVQKLFAKWQEEQKPPTMEEIQRTLDQEYASIKVELFVKVANEDTPQKREFTLRELPQAVERKFYRQFVQRMKDKAPQLQALAQRNMDQPFEKVLGDFMDTIDGAFDVMAEAVAIVLDPYNEDKEITAAWVAGNISSNRQYSIIQAQMEVNKLRDFFSRVFQSGNKVGTMTKPLNFQSLLELAR